MKEYNIEIVGAPGVGKSTFTIRLVQGIFVQNYDPTRQDLYRRKVVEQVTDHSQIHYTINLLDTVGKEHLQNGVGSSPAANGTAEEAEDGSQEKQEDTQFMFGQGFVVLYDITSEESFTAACTIAREILEKKKDKKTPMILVGNKLDLEESRQVLRTAGVDYAAAMSSCQFNEISCKDNTNVLQVVKDLVKVIDKRTGGIVPKDNSGGCVIS